DSMEDRDLFINRELSWLEFNARVLEEAQDATVPLLERLKFLAIFSGNLDEFYMVRVAGLNNREPGEISSPEANDGQSTREVLASISRRVHDLVKEQYRILNEEVLPGIAKAGLKLVTVAELPASQGSELETYFQQKIMPVLTPMAIDPAHPFPHIQNRFLYLGVFLKTKARGKVRAPETFLAIIPVPPILPRFVPVTSGEGNDRFVLLEELIGSHLGQIFQGFAVQEYTIFRLTRDQDFELTNQDSEDLMKQIQSELSKRKRGAAVRLEIGKGVSEGLSRALTGWFELEADDVFAIEGPLNLSSFWSWWSLPGYAALKDEAHAPQPPKRVQKHKGDLFSLIRQGDLLLHHPYESFDTVLDFVEQAAKDPDVLAIKQTLYRTGRNSPIIAALLHAAERDKQVTALVELKARFDEEANIEWARQLERVGAHVVYGLVGLKTHCKVTLVVRNDGDRIRRYVHLGTGNYNPGTAKMYTDLALMTCDDRIGEEVALLFNMMTGYSLPPKWQKIAVAPHGLREWLIEKVDREIAHRQAGREGRIIAKMNALVDGPSIRALYRASQAGVPVELVVRGICCLRPGIPGMSDTIRVRSIVGRYLEHSRIFYFANGGAPEVFLGSADWMPRNFDRRVEVIFPVEDKALKQRLVDEILAVTLLDDAKARVLLRDGTYARVGGSLSSQRVFQELAQGAERTFQLPPPAGELPRADTSRRRAATPEG
ncbi:MAG TPA: polyphosphate kinase 1, partial [Planctomycetota bacterium]|nr:polyphosphate kinase 1 [Planctomycetota bacterium]